ncbi:MAG TPA: RusA family crossover junction endodeoxyribonuclease [Bryobacteraceae bacterium]|jgi:Holliday junction resolvase RusA-like endonuclease
MIPMFEPPPFGEIQLAILAPPVSQQARRTEKDKFANLIRSQIGQCQFLLAGDVAVDIEWLVHEQRRYESDEAPDVDNILKPLLDTLCGPEGLMIDDCQVQAVACRWIDSASREEECIQIRLRFEPDEWLSKRAFCLVHLGKGLCFPLNRNAQPGAVLLLVDQIEAMLTTRNKLIERGKDYYTAKGVMSVQRLFHRSRVGRFTVIELDSLRAELNQEMTAQPACPGADDLDRAMLDLRTRLASIISQGLPELATERPHRPAPDPESPREETSAQ